MFASEKLESSDEIVNTVKNMTITDVGYEFNAVTASDARVKPASDQDKITHTSNGITDQKLLSSRTIGICHEDVSVLLPLKQLGIGAIVLVPQNLKLPAVQEVFSGKPSNNTGTNRNRRRISRNGVDVTTPVHSGISDAYAPAPSEKSATRINGINGTSTPTYGIIGTSKFSATIADPTAGYLWSPRIGNIWQFTSPNLRKSDELNATVDGKFSNGTIASPVPTQVYDGKLSDS